MPLSDHISALIKELKRQKLPEWHDDTFDDLTDPCLKDDEETILKNLNVRLKYLKETRGSIPWKLSEMADKYQKEKKDVKKGPSKNPKPNEKAFEKPKEEKIKAKPFRGIAKTPGDGTPNSSGGSSSEQPTNEKMQAQQETQLLHRKRESESLKAIGDWLDHIEMLFKSTKLPDFKLNQILLPASGIKMERVAGNIRSLVSQNTTLATQGKECADAIQRIKDKCNSGQQEPDKSSSAKKGKKADQDKSEATVTADLVEKTIDRLKQTESKLINQGKECADELQRIKDKCNDGQQEPDKLSSAKKGKKADRDKSDATVTADLVEETIDRFRLTESKLINQGKEYVDALQRIKDKCNDGQQEPDNSSSAKKGKKVDQVKSEATVTAELVEKTIDRLKLSESNLIDEGKEYVEALLRIKDKCNNKQEGPDKSSSEKKGKKADRDKSEATVTAELVEDTIDRFRLTESKLINQGKEYVDALQRIKDKCIDGQQEPDKSSSAKKGKKADQVKSEATVTAELVEKTIDRLKLSESNLIDEGKEYFEALLRIKDKCNNEQEEPDKSSSAKKGKKADRDKSDATVTAELVEDTIDRYELRVSDLQRQLKENMVAITRLNADYKVDVRETSISNKLNADQLKREEEYKTTFSNAVQHIGDMLKSQRQSIQESQQQMDMLNKINDILKDVNGDNTKSLNTRKHQKQEKESSDPADSFGLLLEKIQRLKTNYKELNQEVSSCCVAIDNIGLTSEGPSNTVTTKETVDPDLWNTIKKAKDRIEERLKHEESCQRQQYQKCIERFKTIHDACTLVLKQDKSAQGNIYENSGRQQGPAAEKLEKMGDRAVQMVVLLTERYTESLETAKNYNSEIIKLRKEKQDAEETISELRHRLSRYMGADLMTDNPNIADLSDSNRPTKLAESFSELYDNEWTNAFEELQNKTKMTDTDVVKSLLEILKFAFDYCHETADKQLNGLLVYVCTPAVLQIESSKKEISPKDIDTVSKQALNDLRKKTFAVASRNLIKYSSEVMKRENISDEDYKNKSCQKYIMSCIDICWLMSIQSPPVYLDFEIDTKGKFDDKKYKAYSNAGKKIDYMVWPPIYISKGGNLLAKGVVQGK